MTKKKRKVERRPLTFCMPDNGPRPTFEYKNIVDYPEGATVLVERGIPIGSWGKDLARPRKARSKAPRGAGGASKTVGAHLKDMRAARKVSSHGDIVQAIKDARHGDGGPSDHPWAEAGRILNSVNEKLMYPVCVDTVAKKLRDF